MAIAALLLFGVGIIAGAITDVECICAGAGHGYLHVMKGKPRSLLARVVAEQVLRTQVVADARECHVEASVAGKDENDPPVVFINPVIEWLGPENETSDEGCLSFPGIYVPVKRSLKARLRATSLDGQAFVAEGEGLYARAMQHEHDHLENRLLVDHVGPLKRQMIKRKLERMTDEEADELQAQGE